MIFVMGSYRWLCHCKGGTLRVVIIYRSAPSSHRPHRSQDQDLHLTVDILQPQACLVSVRAGGRLHSELVFLFSSLVPGNLGVDVDIEWVMALGLLRYFKGSFQKKIA